MSLPEFIGEETQSTTQAPNFPKPFLKPSRKLFCFPRGSTMASSFLRSQSSICRLLSTKSFAPFKNNPFPPYKFEHYQQQQRFRSSNFFKRGQKVDSSAPNVISSSSGSTSLPRIGLVSWYLGMVKSRPILTKSITSSLIYIAADLSSQTIALPSSASYDFSRTLRMATYGLVILGPTLHFWFNLMSRTFPGCDLLSTAKKMVLGQSIYGPLMTVIFFSMNAALQGEHYTDIIARLRRDLLTTLLNGVMFWPVCDFITFRFVPVHLQPLMSNGFSYIWTIYLTYMASLEKAS